MDDVLTIVTRPVEVRGARMQLSQSISRDDQLLVQASVTIAVVNGLGRARRLPDELLARFTGGGTG